VESVVGFHLNLPRFYLPTLLASSLKYSYILSAETLLF
jgi:hypothetical protein